MSFVISTSYIWSIKIINIKFPTKLYLACPWGTPVGRPKCFKASLLLCPLRSTVFEPYGHLRAS